MAKQISADGTYRGTITSGGYGMASNGKPILTLHAESPDGMARGTVWLDTAEGKKHALDMLRAIGAKGETDRDVWDLMDLKDDPDTGDPLPAWYIGAEFRVFVKAAGEKSYANIASIARADGNGHERLNVKAPNRAESRKVCAMLTGEPAPAEAGGDNLPF